MEKYRLKQLRKAFKIEDIQTQLLMLPIKIMEVSTQDIVQVARLKARGAMSYADCFAIQLAQKMDATILTGDTEFAQFENEVSIDWV